MKKVISKNFKLVFVALISIMLFFAVNYCSGDNAKASEANDGAAYRGHKVPEPEYSEKYGTKFEFNKNYNNFSEFYLDIDHKPTVYHDHTDHAHYTFFQTELFYDAFIGDVNDDHPGARDDFWFGGDEHDGEGGTNEFRLLDVRFAFTKIAENCENVFVLHYGKDTPWTSGKQNFAFTFDLACQKPDGSVEHLTTGDDFDDYYDDSDNDEVLERAGHAADHGASFDEALKLVNGGDTGIDMITAFETGKIKVTVTNLVCDQE